MDWHRLDRDKTVTMINSVNPAGNTMLFSPVTSEAKCARLPFYANHLLYRLTNFSSMPTFTMDFIGDGEKYAYLDGTEEPIKRVNELFGLTLDTSNIIPYLNFYFFHVRSDEGDILLLKNADEGAHIDLYDEERREDMTLHPDNAVVTFNAEKNYFEVTCPVYYFGGLVEATIYVFKDGTVIVHPNKMIMTGLQ